MTPLDRRCIDLVEDLGLGSAAEVRKIQPLTGGVASDIARVTVGTRIFAVKFALERLRVAEPWFAPPHRSRAEYRWLEAAGRVARGAVPALHGYSEATGGFAMEFVEGPGVRNWKAALLAGAPAAEVAGRLAAVLGAVHAAGAAPGFDRAPFANAADFHTLRTEPYLLFTATRHPAVADRLRALATALDRASVTLVHGDVSPKNILVRDGAPVILDAECATIGDPAFDVAFCLNHLILKSFHLPAQRDDLRAAARGFWAAYATAVRWETPDALEARVAALLPALMLARVDGKSPVEYLGPEAAAMVRRAALRRLARPAQGIGDLIDSIDDTEPQA
jgi:aminoglycoside phosphotransferase (APT) family kinase protein